MNINKTSQYPKNSQNMDKCLMWEHLIPECWIIHWARDHASHARCHSSKHKVLPIEIPILKTTSHQGVFFFFFSCLHFKHHFHSMFFSRSSFHAAVFRPAAAVPTSSRSFMWFQLNKATSLWMFLWNTCLQSAHQTPSGCTSTNSCWNTFLKRYPPLLHAETMNLLKPPLVFIYR